MEFFIARHGQDMDNASGILNGRRDEPLTDLGRQQALNLASEMKNADMKFDAVYASPLLRAHQTAEIICSKLDIDPPIVHEGLKERDFGIMTGQPLSKINEMCAPDVLVANGVTYFLNPERAETFPALKKRAQNTFRDIKSKHDEDEKILLVTHGDMGKMIYAAYYSLEWEEVLKGFHFGNSDLLILSPNSTHDLSHMFKFEQSNL